MELRELLDAAAVQSLLVDRGLGTGAANAKAGLFAAGNIPFMLQNVGGEITRTMTAQMVSARVRGKN